MRYVLAALLLAWAMPANAKPATPKQVSSEARVKSGFGVVAISIRSEIFLPDKLDVFFRYLDGRIWKYGDDLRFSRSQSMLAIGNDTTDYATKTYLLPAGRYRLVGYGVNCPSVPPPGMICAVGLSYGGATGPSISRPSRGYAGETPEFVVEAGKLTVLGDFALVNSNDLLWSALPGEETRKLQASFPSMPRHVEPTVPEAFRLKQPLRGRGMFDNLRREY